MPAVNTQEFILIATITAIEKHGLANVTTRRIAHEAKVNNAALHYYYGTKEALVEKALALTLEQMKGDTAGIFNQQLDYRQRLSELFHYLADGVLKFPNLFRAHLSGPLMDGVADTPFLGVLNYWLENSLGAELEASLSDADHQKVRMAFQSAVSAILFAGLLPEGSGFSSTIDIRPLKRRDAFLEQLVTFVSSQLPE